MKNKRLLKVVDEITKSIKNDNADGLLIAMVDYIEIMEAAKRGDFKDEDWQRFSSERVFGNNGEGILNLIWNNQSIECFRCLVDETRGLADFQWIKNTYPNNIKMWTDYEPADGKGTKSLPTGMTRVPIFFDNLVNASYVEATQWWAAAKECWLPLLAISEEGLDGIDRAVCILKFIKLARGMNNESEVLVAMHQAKWISLTDIENVMGLKNSSSLFPDILAGRTLRKINENSLSLAESLSLSQESGNHTIDKKITAL